MQYCKNRYLLTYFVVLKLIILGGVEWVDKLVNYVELSTLFNVISTTPKNIKCFKHIIRNYDIWSIPGIEEKIINIYSENMIKFLAFNAAGQNIIIKDSIILIIIEYIKDKKKQEIYTAALLNQ